MKFHESNFSALYPLAPVYPFDTGTAITSRVEPHTDGYVNIVSPLFKNVKDISINRKTLLMLTRACKLDEILDISSVSLNLNTLLFKASLQATTDIFAFVRINYDTDTLYITPNWHIGNDTFFLFRAIPPPFSYLSEPVMQIYISRPKEWTKTGLLTVNRNWPYELYVADPIVPDSKWQQRFRYSVMGNIIRIRSHFWDANDKITELYMSFDADDNRKVKLIGDMNHNYDFYLQTADPYQQFITTNFDGNSYWIKYQNEMLSQQNNRNVEINGTESISGIPLNYLCSSAYENLQVRQNDVGAIPYNFSTLKNFQTPEYEYTDNKFFVSRYRVRGNVRVQTGGTSLPAGDQPGPQPPTPPSTEPPSSLGGITMKGFPTTVVTDASGNYSTYVDYDFTSTIYPDLPNYLFTPSAADLTSLAEDVDQDFVGEVASPPIGGKVTDVGGNPLSGITIKTDSSYLTTTTDASGNYTINVPYNWNGILAVSGIAVYNPPTALLINVQDATVQNFTRTT